MLVIRTRLSRSVCDRAAERSSVASDHAMRVVHRAARCAIVAVCLFPSFLCLGCAAPPAADPTPALPTSAQAGATTVVAVAAPAPPTTTLPQFLGLNGLFGGIRMIGQRIRNRLGARFPGLESRPPVLAITDPANLGPDASPAVKAAAEAKAEEDAAPQKAKAIRYLASLGCGRCYPDTEDALLAALEDCNELIRYETVQGLRKSAGDACQCCRENSCCSPKLMEKLYQMAYEMDGTGCYLEPSARVRRNARLVIRGCGGYLTGGEPVAPQEGPSSPADDAGQSVITASATSEAADLDSGSIDAKVVTAAEPPPTQEPDDDPGQSVVTAGATSEAADLESGILGDGVVTASEPPQTREPDDDSGRGQ